MGVSFLLSGECGPVGMQLYAELFKENHITGKRLLLLSENDMRDMGVKSKGHIMHLKVIQLSTINTAVSNPYKHCTGSDL